ncbi:hypothetical protein [Flavobacterium sp.]|uniref:hypothetical protein n=1 Tax=Flavobacterium sp. TaxID=239 RepID=UPI003D111E76
MFLQFKLGWTKVQPYNMFRADGSYALRKSSGGTIDIVASGFNPMDSYRLGF